MSGIHENLIEITKYEFAPDIAPYNLKNLRTEETYEYKRGKEIFEELNDNFFKLPFKKMEPAYDWKCPEKE